METVKLLMPFKSSPLLTVCNLFWLKAMESVTVETVTVRLVGMEINVNSSVTSPPGRSRKDAHLQMAKSAATEVCHSHVPFTLIFILQYAFSA